MRAIRQSGSMSGMWKRSHGRTSEAPPDESGGYRYVRPTATASHLDSTLCSRWLTTRVWAKMPPFATFATAREAPALGDLELFTVRLVRPRTSGELSAYRSNGPV